MSRGVDTPIRAGAFTVAAIFDQQITAKTWGHSIVGRGERRPVLLLFLKDGALSGVDLAGRHYNSDEIERYFPRAAADMIARSSGTA